MNKLLKYFTLLIIVGSLFISCSKKESSVVSNYKYSSKYAIDENGFFTNPDDAMKCAQNKDQNIIVMVTAEGDDELSEAFMEVAGRGEFAQKVLPAFTIVHLDFSQKAYSKTIISETATAEEKAEAEYWANQLQENSQFASLLNASSTPSFYLMTKDEYFICELKGEMYGEEYIPSTADQFLEIVLAQSEKIDYITKLVNKTKDGSKIDRINAIDELYENTEYNYRVFLADLVETVIKLDKKNDSGLLDKYLYIDAENIALNYLVSGDMEKCVKAYLALTDNPKIGPKYLQKSYFMAAYILSLSGSTDISSMIQYLTYALEADPEGDLVEPIKAALNVIANDGE